MNDNAALTRAVRDLVVAGERYRDAVGRPQQLDSTRLSALGQLYLDGPCTPTEIARNLGVSTASATELLDKLERAGHLQRRAHPADRRKRLIELTASGHELVAATYRDFAERLAPVHAALPATERHRLLDFLRAASHALASSP